MSLPVSLPSDALPEGDLCYPRLISPSASPASLRPDHGTMVMVLFGATRHELRAEARGGIGGGQYGQDEEVGLDYFAGRVRR